MLLTKDNSFYCRKPNGVYTRVRWKKFYVVCPKISLTCNAKSWAYVSAITICNQQLWSGWGFPDTGENTPIELVPGGVPGLFG